MKMVLSGLGRLEIRDMAPLVPDPSKDEAAVRVLACAVCRTDAKMWEQGHRDLVFPRVLGHEMAVADGSGERFVVWPGTCCGRCRFCRSGRENLCEHMKIMGFHLDGGFARQVLVPRSSLIPIPAAMDPGLACFAEPVGCVINAFEKIQAFEKIRATPRARVLIFGGGTMGLITALYARSLGLDPLVLEKQADKIGRISPILEEWGVSFAKETRESEFDIVINACPDYIAFCQAVTKVAKAGHISFFSGITKNEQIETNLVNLIHYKEAVISGAYGMKPSDMAAAIPFILDHAPNLERLVEARINPRSAPDLMPRVLSGRHLKFILDFTGGGGARSFGSRPDPAAGQSGRIPAGQNTAPGAPDLPGDSLARQIIARIRPLPHTLTGRAVAKMDDKAKPLGALGRLEALAVQMCRIQDSLDPEIRQKNLFVFAGDHGITEEGVSAFPSEVTGQMVENFLNRGAAINVLCRHFGIQMKVVDMGVKKEFSPHPDLIMAKVAPGTKNFALEPAMTREQMVRALENGMHAFLDAHERSPVQILGLGEMGIGNTTSAAAIISAVTGISPADAAGRGTGIDDKALEHKIEVLEKVLNFHRPDPGDGLGILRKIGGFEIAGIAGAALAAAANRCAVVLDGVISTAAGLIAHQINPAVQGYLISGHRSVEPAQKAALDHMALTPAIDFDMRLGEGTGAAFAMDAVQAACDLMTRMASFDEARISRHPE